ncbi:MAG: MATE family efflux transporter [Flavobacteriales bacterium]|nr:MATE family efflux transporter [Flavobacteriales bacterium]
MPKENSYSQIWKITYPIIIGYLAQNIVYVVDTAFLGRVSEVALGAGGLAGLYYIAIFMLGMGFGTGSQIMMARRHGQGDTTSIGKILDHSWYFLMAFAVVVFLILKYATPFFFDIALSSGGVNAASMEYLDYRAFGIFFAFINVAFRAFFVGIGKTQVLIWSTVVMAVVNIALDYALIFGNWGFPEMGIGGAALASVISEGFAMLYFAWYALSKGEENQITFRQQYNFLQLPKVDFAAMKNLLKISIPVMFQNFISLGGWFLFYLIIEGMGERPLAISNIVRSIYLILMIPAIAFYSATYTLVSNTMGRDESHEIKPLLKRIIGLGFLFSLVLSIIISLIPEYVVEIYTNDANLLLETIPTLRVVTVALLLIPFSMVMFAAVAGTGNTIESLVLEVTTVLIYLSCTYYFARVLSWPVEQVWYTELIYLIILGTLSVVFFKTWNWRRAKV